MNIIIVVYIYIIMICFLETKISFIAKLATLRYLYITFNTFFHVFKIFPSKHAEFLINVIK